MTKTLVRLAAVLAIALCTSGCSTISDLIGDDSADTTAAADTNGFPPDTAPTTATADGTKPDLAAIPDKPTGTTSPDAQRAASDSLAADAARSRYSSDALRGGTEPAAAPPPPPSANPPPQVASAAAPAPAAPDNSAPTPAPDNSTPSRDATPQPAPAAPAPSVQPPPSAPAAAPAPGRVPGAQPMVMSDAALGFKPSSAPPLDPSVSQFVAQPIIARYQQTAANAALGAVGGTPQAVVLFPGDGTSVTATARAQIKGAVQAFHQRGGSGYIKVVGHSSSRTANMPVEKHLMTIFAKSQARANAVASEIIRDGVPASHVLVEAVGDSQPV